MNTINFLPGAEVNNVGTVTGLHFSDLFDFKYVVNDTLHSESDIKDKLVDHKEQLVDRLIYLLQFNTKIAYKFLNKIMLKTQSIPLINSLNDKLSALQNQIEHQDFDWDYYSSNSQATRKLKDFLFLYYSNK